MPGPTPQSCSSIKGSTVALALALAPAFGALACGAPPAPVPVAATAPLTGHSAVTPAPGGAAAVRTDVACLDTTTSVPAGFGSLAQEWVARQVERAVSGPMPPATFYVRLTTSASYSTAAGLLTVRLPEISPAPPPPALPENPYQARERAELARHHTEETVRWQAHLRDAQDHAAREAARVRSAALPRDDRGTDLFGCVIKAAELLGPTGDRMLFVASDLVASGPQQTRLPALDGVRVIIFPWCAEVDAAACLDRRDAFMAALGRTGAGPMTVLDPQQIA